MPPGVDPSDPANRPFLQQIYDTELLLPGIEAWFGGASGDAETCAGDGGGPVIARVGTRNTVFGTTSWGFGSTPLSCQPIGGAFASMNPVSLDFIDYETHCPLVPRPGSCEDTTVAVRCAEINEGGRRIVRTDCGELGQVCGIDDTGALGCIDDPCEGLPPEGVCSGEVALRCSLPGEGFRHVVTTDCAAQGQSCSTAGGTVACVAPASCAHGDCVVGAALTPACDACSAAICSADPFCCNVTWDGICVSEVGTVCGQSCPASAVPADGRRS